MTTAETIYDTGGRVADATSIMMHREGVQRGVVAMSFVHGHV